MSLVMTKQVIPLYPADGSTLANTYQSAQFNEGRRAAYKEGLGFAGIGDPSVYQPDARMKRLELTPWFHLGCNHRSHPSSPWSGEQTHRILPD
jgi:hypothetical protein